CFRLPLEVSATDRERWFPTFTGALEADDVGVGDTRLRLTGTYELPLGALGRMTGRAGADKLARASLYSLFVNVVSGAERELRETEPAWRPALAPEIVRRGDDPPLRGRRRGSPRAKLRRWRHRPTPATTSSTPS